MSLEVGGTFTGVTHKGRVITLAKVTRIDPDPMFSWTHLCVWYDEHGKHLEWFSLEQPSLEFREFRVVSQPKEEAYVQATAAEGH